MYDNNTEVNNDDNKNGDNDIDDISNSHNNNKITVDDNDVDNFNNGWLIYYYCFAF